MEIVEMDVVKIKLSNQNSEERVKEVAIRDLVEDIRNRGIVYPLVVNREGILIDGHRRLRCAQILEMETVPVIVREEPFEELFPVLNTKGRRNLTSRDWICSWMKGFPLEALPRSSRTFIREFLRVGGDELIRRIYDAGLSPSTWQIIRRIRSWCGVGRDDLEFTKKIVCWLIEGRRVFMARTAFAIGVSPVALYDAVNRNVDLSFEAHGG